METDRSRASRRMRSLPRSFAVELLNPPKRGGKVDEGKKSTALKGAEAQKQWNAPDYLEICATPRGSSTSRSLMRKPTCGTRRTVPSAVSPSTARAV